MKKVFGLILILFGGLFIGGGIFVQVSGNSPFNKNKIEDPVIVRADVKGAKTYCDGEMIDTYLQLNDFTKISFSYPECVKEKRLSYHLKQLSSEDRTIRMDVSVSNDKPKAFLNTKKTYLISLGEDEHYTDFDYSDIKEIKYGDISAYYFDATYYSVNIIDNSKMIRDEWYIAVPFKNSESHEEKILTIALTSIDKAISSSAIEELIKSLKIEENKAEFIHSKEEGEYLVGSIKQNKFDSYEHGYILKYKAPKSLPETASTNTDINSVVFSTEDIDKSEFVNISLDNSSESAIDNAKSYYGISNKEDKNQKIKEKTEIKFMTYNNYNVYYFITSYDYYHSETKEYLSTYYTLYAFIEISKNDYAKIYMSNKKIPITEEKFKKYLNFQIEEY